MARLFTIPESTNQEIDYGIINKIKAEMFPGDAKKHLDDFWWERVEEVEFDFIDKGRWSVQRFSGLQMKTSAGTTVIRKAMVKDGKIDIDKCLAKFEELQEIRRKHALDQATKDDIREQLNAEVDQFIKDMAPMPPGFVIRTYGDNGWTVEYSTRDITRDKAARIVEAIRRAISE